MGMVEEAGVRHTQPSHVGGSHLAEIPEITDHHCTAVDIAAAHCLPHRMFPDYLFRLIVLAALSLAGPLLASPSLQSPSTGWEKVPVGEPDSVAWFSGILASSEDLLVLPVGGKLALIDAQTGVQRMLVAKPTDMNSGGQFAMSAGFVGGHLVTVSIASLSLRLDELDIATGTWGRSASLPIPYVRKVEAPILFNGEIRIQGTDHQIYRCSAADWSPLPTLSIGGFEVHASPLSCMIGDSYLTGYTSDIGTSEMRIEKPDGQKLTLPLPKKYSFSGEVGFACSPSYFVASDRENAFIWNARNLGLSPRVVPINDKGGTYATIWKDRYWLISDTDGGESSIWIRDLAQPELTPGRIAFPSAASYADLHASRKNLWYAGSATLGRFAIGDTPQLNVVTLTGARANERDGTLKFKVSATPPPLMPITVELATAPISATEGEDYQGWTGTVTLTSAAPSAEVPIQIISDLKLENYETMRLTVKSVANGACFNREATGVIVGTEVAETTTTDPLPEGTSPLTLAWVDSGLVARNWDEGKVYYCANGQRSWKRITAMPVTTEWGVVKLIPAPGNRLFFVRDNGESISEWMEIDVSRDVLMPQGPLPYSAPADGRVPVDENFYLIQVKQYNYPTDRIELRRCADSSLVRVLSLPFDIDSQISLLGGREGISLIQANGGTYFHQFAADGSDTYRFGGVTGTLLAVHPGHLGVIRDYDQPTELWDTAAPVKLASFAESWIFDGNQVFANTAAPVAGCVDNDDAIHQFALAPKVPVPLKRAFKGSESAPDVPFSVEFSEATDFPVSVSVAWCSSSADIRIAATPAILPPGQRKLVLPFTLNDDHVAEGDEIVRVGLCVSGNGATEVFDISVTVKDNDIVEFGETVRDKELVLSTAMDIAAGSPLFAFAHHSAVADPVTQKIFQPSAGNDDEIFGHTVTGNAKYALIGSPGRKGVAHNSFYILDRKGKKLVKRVTRPGANTGFASVLHLHGHQVFVGAPGDKAIGTVFYYEIPGGKLLHEFKQPGNPKTGTRYGIAIASDGKSVWIGAPREGDGAVYQFSAATGKLIRKYKAPGATTNYGHSLAICGDYVAVGAPSRNAASAVLIYKRRTGSLVGSIPSPFIDGGCFGASLAGMGGSRLAIGCPERPGSHFGAAMIHDLSAKSFPLVIMLSPSSAANKYHSERSGTMGATGSLSAHGDFLGIQFGHGNSLTAYDGGTSGTYSHVIYIAPVAKTQSEHLETSAAAAPAAVNAPSDSPEISAAASQGLRISCDGSEAKISLPAPTVAGPDMTLVLEASEDLAKWTEIAATGGGSQQWMPLTEEAVLDPATNEIRLPAAASGRCYFRLRMKKTAGGAFRRSTN